MEYIIQEIAQRIKSLREILEISPDEMAEINGISTEEYLRGEAGETDFSLWSLSPAKAPS